MMPGTATPGEMEQAMRMGLDVVKFFRLSRTAAWPS